MLLGENSDDEPAQATFISSSSAPDAHAKLIVNHETNSALILARNLPATDEGQQYVAWLQLAGLDVSGEIDEALLRQLANRRAEEREVPTPAPRPTQVASARRDDGLSRDDIVRIQAGLKAFGHDGIEIDGVVGFKTKGAIREFQSLFGLPVTGEPDVALMEKMREIGLTN